MPKIINVFFLLNLYYFCLICCSSCTVTTTEPKYIPDVKGITTSMELIRFEQDFFRLDTSNIGVELEKLKEKHPEFTIGFLGSVIGIRDSSIEDRMVKGYLSFPSARITYDTIQQLFGDVSQVQKELNELATYYQYYFPEAVPLKKAFTYLCEYHGDRLAILEEGFVGLPLDMTLGVGYPAYIVSKMPLYDQRTCTKEHLVTKAANAVAQNLEGVLFKPRGTHLIDLMLFNGKTMYLTDILLPNTTDSLKLFFSSTQMKFCKESGSELKLYEHLVEEELLYSSETKKIAKYVTKGPFKPQLRLPGNSGTWLGYRMILSFAKHHRTALKQAQPNLSNRAIDQQILKIILEENDPQKFLKFYKPPKN
jgi:hypothetical protein